MFRKIFLSILFSAVLSAASYARDIEVYFTPSYKALDTVVDLINISTKNIDVAMYDFTSRPISHALILAKRRGIDIRVVLDRKSNDPKENRYTKYTYLRSNDINVRFAKPHRHWNRDGIMHNKFTIIDNKIVVTGSANWTASAFAVNDENIIIIRRSDIANVYKKEFETLWRNAKTE